jgi:hypothetical protein
MKLKKLNTLEMYCFKNKKLAVIKKGTDKLKTRKLAVI